MSKYSPKGPSRSLVPHTPADSFMITGWSRAIVYCPILCAMYSLPIVLPCYCCLIGAGWYDTTAEEITNEDSARQNGQIAAYTSPEDAEAMVQVGLSSDIEPICNLMVKLTLMELSRGKESGISCLEDELVYDYYMWANRRERRHANWAPLPEAGNRPTILRWYGAKIKKVENCPLCSKHIALDEGDEDEMLLNHFTGSDIVD